MRNVDNNVSTKGLFFHLHLKIHLIYISTHTHSKCKLSRNYLLNTKTVICTYIDLSGQICQSCHQNSDVFVPCGKTINFFHIVKKWSLENKSGVAFFFRDNIFYWNIYLLSFFSSFFLSFFKDIVCVCLCVCKWLTVNKSGLKGTKSVAYKICLLQGWELKAFLYTHAHIHTHLGWKMNTLYLILFFHEHMKQ